MRRRPVILKPDVPLESLASAVLLQAFVDFLSSNPETVKEAKMFIEQDGSIWLEAAGIPYVDARFWIIRQRIKARKGYIKQFENRV
jgi:hypothetical protein